MTIVLFYVDDILILSFTESGVDSFNKDFRGLEEVSVSRSVNRFLRPSLHWSTGSTRKLETLALSQLLCKNKMLRKLRVSSAKSALTATIESFWSAMKTGTVQEAVDPQLYQQMTGSPQFLALQALPDILTVVTILSRLQNSPTAFCHSAVNHLFQYLRGTLSYLLTYNAEDLELSTSV